MEVLRRSKCREAAANALQSGNVVQARASATAKTKLVSRLQYVHQTHTSELDISPTSTTMSGDTLSPYALTYSIRVRLMFHPAMDYEIIGHPEPILELAHF